MKKFITNNSKQTQELGKIFAQELLNESRKNAKVICLSGELGAGKTTFTQGMLKGFQVEGPYTSPTFVIMKEHFPEIRNLKSIAQKNKSSQKIYHIDAYRITAEDILSLGWKEMISNPPAGGNIIIVEWAERIKKIIPQDAVWIKFKWIDKDKREIGFDSKF